MGHHGGGGRVGVVARCIHCHCAQIVARQGSRNARIRPRNGTVAYAPPRPERRRALDCTRARNIRVIQVKEKAVRAYITATRERVRRRARAMDKVAQWYESKRAAVMATLLVVTTFFLAAPVPTPHLALGTITFYEGHQAHCAMAWCILHEDAVYDDPLLNGVWSWSVVANTAWFLFVYWVDISKRIEPHPFEMTALALVAFSTFWILNDALGHLNDHNARVQPTWVYYVLQSLYLCALADRTWALYSRDKEPKGENKPAFFGGF